MRGRDEVRGPRWLSVSGAGLICGAVMALAVLAGCGVPVPAFPSSASTAAGPRPDGVLTNPPPGSAAEVLATLQVRRDVDVPGYRRSLFGRAWLDTDSDGCNQRADTWPAEARLAFATDTRGLQATSAAQNAGKGSRAADVWLPSSPGFRCRYVALQVDVKSRWHLSVTAAEFAALGRVLSGCPAQPMPEVNR